jgi:hypothetical protein
MAQEVRKLPKKTVIWMVVLILLGVVWIQLVSFGQQQKVKKILHTLEYTDVSNIKVYANHEFLREDINVKGYKYTVSFTDNKKGEDCKGFVLKDFKRNVTKDLICHKIGK